MLKELQNQEVELKKEIENINESKEKLRSEKNKLDMDKQDLESELKMKVQREKDKLIPEIEKYQQMIEDMHKQIADNEDSIQKETDKTEELDDLIINKETKKDDLRDKFDGLQNEYLKQKDEPNRLGKNNDNMQIAVNHLKSELDSIHRDISTLTTQEANEKDVKEKLQEKKKQHDQEMDHKKRESDEQKFERRTLDKKCEELAMQSSEINQKNITIKTEITSNTG